MLGVHGTATALVLGSLNGSLELKQVQLADDLRDDEIIVRMAATGICHTDLASMTVSSQSNSFSNHENRASRVEADKGLNREKGPQLLPQSTVTKAQV